jgi:hypothetical protein
MRNLDFVGTNKGVPGDDWWEWDVPGVPAEDWRKDEMHEIIGFADFLLAERFRGSHGESRVVRYSFTREGLCCNRFQPTVVGAYR